MKHTKAISRIFSGLAIVLLAFTMLPAGALVGAADINTFTVKVYGSGVGSSSVVEGAEVVLETAGRSPVSAVTASNGEAIFSVADGNALVQGAAYTYTVIREGYTTLRSETTEGSFVPQNGLKSVTMTFDGVSPTIVNVMASPNSGWTKDPVIVTINATDNVGIEGYSFDGGSKWQAENTLEVTDNTTFAAGIIRVKDTAGNVTSYLSAVVIDNIDHTAPTIRDVQLFPDAETNDSVTVEIIADDNRMDAEIEYSMDGGETWSTNPYAIIAENTILPENSIMVRDDLGNETSYPYELHVTKINKLAPTISSVTPDKTAPTNSAVTITVAASFNLSAGYTGSQALSYSFDGGESWQAENYLAVTENQTIPAGTIRVKDAAGNIAIYYSVIQISNIDTQAPVIKNIEIKNRGGVVGGWDSLSNIVTFQVPDTDISRVWVQTTDVADLSAITLAPNGQNYSFSVNENGTVYLFAMDLTGNMMSAVPVVISKIDQTAPVVNAPVKSPTKDWHNGAVEITATATDNQTSGDLNGAGIDRVVYSHEYNTYAAASANHALQEATWDASSGSYYFSTPDEAFVGTYYIWAIDKVGHVSQTASIAVQIDKTAPVNPAVSYVKDTDKGFVKELVNVLTFGLFFKDKVTILVSAQDGESGIAKYQYQLVSMGTSISDTAWVDIALTSVSAEFAVPYATFAGKLYIRAWDAAGNVTEAVTDLENDTTIVMDNTSAAAPTVVLNGRLASEWTGAWTNSDVVITLSGSDPISGVDYYQYYIDYADSNLTDIDWTMMPDTDGTLARAEGGTISNKMTINSDIEAQISFRAVSNTAVAGASSAAVNIKVQKTAPENATCSLAPTNGRNTAGQDTGWYVGSFSAPHLAIIEPTAIPNTAPIKTYYKLWNTSAGEAEFDVEEVLFSGTQPVFTADGIYMLKIWTKDAAGNICDTEHIIVREIKIATALPSNLSIMANGRSIVAADPDCVIFNVFFNTAVEVNLSASFGISGQHSLMYQKVRNAAQFNPTGTWVSYDPDTGIPIDPSDKFVIYFRAEDEAGNVVIIHTDGVILDDQPATGESGAPELSIAPKNASENGFYNEDVAVDISVRDPRFAGTTPDEENGVCSGLESITYRVIAGGVETKAKTILFPIDGAEYVYNEEGLVEAWSGSMVVAAQDNNSNDVIVEVTAVDNAGNSRTTRTQQGIIKIDITKPAIDIRYDNNQVDLKSGGNAFFSTDRVATIVVTERNFRPEDATVVVTRDGARIDVACSWELVNPGSGNQDDKAYQATILYRTDGDYTFSIDYTDVAGNANEPVSYAAGTVAPELFSVDQTKPRIAVEYNNNAATNGRYFDKARTATITVTERNFDPGRVVITRTASLGGAPVYLQTTAAWVDLGNHVHTLTLENTLDGNYIFNVAAQDMAGNENAPVQYGSSVAANDFTIDTKFETLTVTGVGDGKFYQGGVAPSIRFEDLNFDRYEIQLTRTRWGEKNVDVTGEFIPRINVDDNGGAVTIRTFEKTRENDGIYRLTVTAHDKAGNTKTVTITFTLNRFGSVYVFNDALIDLQDSYVRSVSKSLVITEYNPTRLVEGSLNIEITRDGVPLNGVKYSVDPPINNTVQISASGWYEYRYTIDPSNFVNANGNPIDGVYQIVVSSRDEANNAQETSSFSDKIILFRIDNVAPEIVSITGLGSRVVNQSSLDVSFEVFDAIGLQQVTVFVNDTAIKSFDTFEEMGGFIGEFSLGQGMNQMIRIHAVDRAGNVTDTDAENFAPSFAFERSVTVSTNLFVRWFANTPFFVGTVVSSALLGGIIWLIIVARKTRKLFS